MRLDDVVWFIPRVAARVVARVWDRIDYPRVRVWNWAKRKEMRERREAHKFNRR